MLELLKTNLGFDFGLIVFTIVGFIWLRALWRSKCNKGAIPVKNLLLFNRRTDKHTQGAKALKKILEKTANSGLPFLYKGYGKAFTRVIAEETKASTAAYGCERRTRSAIDSINPSSGLPMVDGSAGGVDVTGKPWGVS